MTVVDWGLPRRPPPAWRIEDFRGLAQRLRRFTVPQLVDETEATTALCRARVAEMLQRGWVRETGENFRAKERGRPVPIYEFVKPSGPPVNRLKEVPVEVAVARQLRGREDNVTRGVTQRKPHRRKTDKDTKKLLAVAYDHGWTTEDDGGHFWLVPPEDSTGLERIRMGSSVSDHRGILNARADMRRAGLPV